MMNKPVTINEWGAMLLEASREIAPEKRATFEELMALLAVPVGELEL